MASAQQWLDVISHNLANVSTAGYKRDVIAFNDGLLREMQQQASGETVGLLGAGPIAKGQYTVFEVGVASATGNPLDLALTSERGMFGIQTAQGQFFTRDGAFTLDNQRRLVTQSGGLVLDDQNRPITIPTGKIEISPEGQIDVNGVVVAKLGVWDGAFTKSGNGMYSASSARLLEDGSGRMQQGAIESSNVNAIEEMIAMIRLNRAFELAQKSAQSQDESSQRLIQSLQDQ